MPARYRMAFVYQRGNHHHRENTALWRNYFRYLRAKRHQAQVRYKQLAKEGKW